MFSDIQGCKLSYYFAVFYSCVKMRRESSVNRVCSVLLSSVAEMVPNLANNAENHCFTKQLPTILVMFLCQNLAIFKTPICSIDETIHLGLLSNERPNLREKYSSTLIVVNYRSEHLDFRQGQVTGAVLCFELKYYVQFSLMNKRESFCTQKSETII